jgi:sec-independent protein translocase protein TatC
MQAEPQYGLPPETEDEDKQAVGKMGFLEHLDELRTRLIYSCIAVAAGMLVAFLFVDRIADFVLTPAIRMLPPGTSLIMTRPGEGFAFYLDVALIAGVVLAAPFVTYQVWRFIAPGLYAREKRLAVPFVVSAVLGTLGGAAFSHYVLFPSMMAFFGTFDTPRVRFMPRIEDTFDLYRNTLLGMVAVFQIPTLVFFLARIRLVTARLLWRHIKYAVLVIFIVAAVLTPSADPWNQTVFAAPMLALYVISIGIAWLVAPRGPSTSTDRITSRDLKLVFVAAVVDQARRRGESRGEFPRLSRVKH